MQVKLLKGEMKKMKKLLSWLLVVLLVVSMLVTFSLAGCKEETAEEETAEEETSVAEDTSEAESTAETEDTTEIIEPLKIGLSNTFMYPWRAQMIDDLEREIAYYQGKGWVSDFTIQNAGADLSTQISQIRNFMASEVDILLINPMSADGLNPVVEEALAQGITVISMDQAITAEGVLNITINHYDWGYQLADWLANALGGEGEVAIITGIDGHPASDARVQGEKDALAQYEGIELVNVVQGGWDVPGAQAAAGTLLTSYPNLAGIATQDGMVLGVMNAAKAANRPDLMMTGETQVAVLKAWSQLKEENGFSSFGIVNPPGIGATALGIAIRIVQGKNFIGEVDEGNIWYYPVKTTVDNNNLDEFLASLDGRPDVYYPDEWLSSDEVDQLFE